MFLRKNKKVHGSKEIFPEDYKASDLYLVEYPKSGITWISFILANILAGINNKNIDITYYNIQQVVPDLHMSKVIGEPFFQYPGYRILKSHSSFNKKYLHSIYMLRNPYDVMRSYFNYLQDDNIFIGSFKEFVQDPKFGISAYVEHVKSWLVARSGPSRVHLIKYEDLLENSSRAIINLLDNLGWKYNDKNIIDNAMEKSKLEYMKKSEEVYRRNDPVYKKIFVGRGKEASGMIFSTDMREYIYNNSKEICDHFYNGMH